MAYRISAGNPLPGQFNDYKSNLEKLINGEIVGLLVHGDPGLGKSYWSDFYLGLYGGQHGREFVDLGATAGLEYIFAVLKEKPDALYRLDDADGFFLNKSRRLETFLKTVFDSGKATRVARLLSGMTLRSGVIEFPTESSWLILTNQNVSEDKALLKQYPYLKAVFDRMRIVGLSRDPSDMGEYILSVAVDSKMLMNSKGKYYSAVSRDVANTAMLFFRDNLHRLKDISFRCLFKLATLINEEPQSWQTRVLTNDSWVMHPDDYRRDIRPMADPVIEDPNAPALPAPSATNDNRKSRKSGAQRRADRARNLDLIRQHLDDGRTLNEIAALRRMPLAHVLQYVVAPMMAQGITAEQIADQCDLPVAHILAHVPAPISHDTQAAPVAVADDGDGDDEPPKPPNGGKPLPASQDASQDAPDGAGDAALGGDGASPDAALGEAAQGAAASAPPVLSLSILPAQVSLVAEGDMATGSEASGFLPLASQQGEPDGDGDGDRDGAAPGDMVPDQAVYVGHATRPKGRAPLLAPFHYFGGKSLVAHEVWARLGNPKVYVEPFFGSGAVLLGRPGGAGRHEIVSDADHYLTNFWNTIQFNPTSIIPYIDYPVSEAKLEAVQNLLINEGAERLKAISGDPKFYDPEVAGMWVWGKCLWIGGGWCHGGPWHWNPDTFGYEKLSSASQHGMRHVKPHIISNRGALIARGIEAKRPDVTRQPGVHRQLPKEFNNRTDFLLDWVMRLHERMRRVNVMCHDWRRVCTPCVTTKLGKQKKTGIFLDPPYSDKAGRATNIYRCDSFSVAHDVREWAIENGNNPLLRIAVAGYEGEHAFPSDWTVLHWQSHGGYSGLGEGNGRENRKKERIWFSPHCLPVGADVEIADDDGEQGEEFLKLIRLGWNEKDIAKKYGIDVQEVIDVLDDHCQAAA